MDTRALNVNVFGEYNWEDRKKRIKDLTSTDVETIKQVTEESIVSAKDSIEKFMVGYNPDDAWEVSLKGVLEKDLEELVEVSELLEAGMLLECDEPRIWDSIKYLLNDKDSSMMLREHLGLEIEGNAQQIISTLKKVFNIAGLPETKLQYEKRLKESVDL